MKRLTVEIQIACAALLCAFIVTESILLVQGAGARALQLLGAGLAVYLILRLQRGWRVVARGRIADLTRLHFSTMEALTIAIDSKDPLARGRVRRVQAYALELARGLKVPEHDLPWIRTAALLHDVGKLAIPEHLLNKPGRLTEVEFRKIKSHPTVAAQILAGVGFPDPVLPIIRHHHERWDGSGYPDALRGEDIPLGARILAVADAFEALTRDRAYRGRTRPAEACAIVEAWSAIHFDPDVVRVLRDKMPEILAAGQAADASPQLALPRRTEQGAPASMPAVTGDGINRSPSGDAYAMHREVYALYEIAQVLGSSLRLPEVLELVVLKTGQLVPCHSCVIYLMDRDEGSLSARFASGANASALSGRSLALGEGITGWAAAHNSPRFSTSPDLDLSGTAIESGEYSMVAAFPLCHEGRVLGAITVLFAKGIPWLDDHGRIMEIIARLSAGAIQHSSILEETEESSLSDGLTHLPSPRHLRQMFDQEAIRSQQSGRPVALIAMNLDDFNSINERHGHPAGDRYLTAVGKVLRDHLRDRDTLLRLSGDEFAAILPSTGFAAAALLAERLQHSVDLFTLRLEEGRVARSGLSVGIAIHPHDGETLEELLSRADDNLQRNKKGRKSRRAGLSANVIPFPVRSPGGTG